MKKIESFVSASGGGGCRKLCNFSHEHFRRAILASGGPGQARPGWWKYDSEKTQQFLFGSATYEPVALKFAYCFYYTLPRPRGAGSAFLCCILYGHGSRCSSLIVSLGHASPHLSSFPPPFASLSLSLAHSISRCYCALARLISCWLQSKLARTQLH